MSRLQIRTLAEWEAIPEPDRRDWLAEEILRQNKMKHILEALNQRVNDNKSIELDAYISVLLAQVV